MLQAIQNSRLYSSLTKSTQSIFIGQSSTLKAEKAVMNAEQIKDEIRKLSRRDKIEIYRWIDEEAAADLLSRIGMAFQSGHLLTRSDTTLLPTRNADSKLGR